MPLLCYLCKNKKATYIFPRDDARKKVWIDSLQLECEPPKHARLCSEHFLESDFYVRGGKKYLVSTSIPTRSVKCKSYLADHNYALCTKANRTDVGLVSHTLLFLTRP